MYLRNRELPLPIFSINGGNSSEVSNSGLSNMPSLHGSTSQLTLPALGSALSTSPYIQSTLSIGPYYQSALSIGPYSQSAQNIGSYTQSAPSTFVQNSSASNTYANVQGVPSTWSFSMGGISAPYAPISIHDQTMTAKIPKITSLSDTSFSRPISHSNSDDQ
ncbi:unnamed protein product [Mytilus coruscus]|uniref:Uncharacterized protein n=1 Tax=Mytilus coruscus TaxID=42192 RepID=A0A6J8A4A7_MYTCO|nr:unnamed protein product [Mytilus coruscus]